MAANKKSNTKKVVIICSVSAVVLIAIAIIAALALGGKGQSELTGTYQGYSNKGREFNYTLYNGTYVQYRDGVGDEYYYKVGTYTVEGSTVTFTTLSGAQYTGEFNKRRNTLVVGDTKYDSTDSKAKLDFDMDMEFFDTFLDRVNNAASETIKNHPEVNGQGIKMDYAALNNPADEFTKDFAENLGFNSDDTLRALLRMGCISFVSVTYGEDGSVYAATYNTQQ